MELIKLTKDQVTILYNERMVEDFPPDELKPLKMILEGMDKGLYECFGLFEKENILSYTYVIKNGDDYLIDYLATYPEHRNKGFGAVTLKLLGEYLKGAHSIIGEVENPEYAGSIELKELQTRRIGFYMRNGFRDTGARVSCFKVPFIMIEMGEGLSHTADEIIDLYLMHFRSLISEEMIRKNIIVMENEKVD